VDIKDSLKNLDVTSSARRDSYKRISQIADSKTMNIDDMI
jgi:hypothetical protein